MGMMKNRLSTVVLVFICLAPAEALASGFGTARFGGEQGSPITTNATAIYYNPAGLAESEGVHLFAEGSFAFRGQTYTHQNAPGDVPEPADAKGANNGKANMFNVIVAPAFGFTAKVKDFAFGVGMFVPFGGSAAWKQNDQFANNPKYAGPVDGPQRWYIIEGTIKSIYFSAAAAYKIPNTGLSLGVSGNLIQSSVHTLRARTTDSTNDINSEGRSLVDVSGLQGSFGVGAMFEAIPKKFWIGASYQTRPNVSGGMVLKGRLKNNFAGTKTDDAVNLSQDLPDVIRLGFRYAVTPEVELRLFGDYTRWSALKNQCIYRENTTCDVQPNGSVPAGSGVLQNIPREWKDGVGVRAGGSFWVKPEVEVFAGLGFDSNVVPDRTLETALTDYNTVSGALGGRVKLGDHLYATLGYTHFFCLPRDTSTANRLGAPPAGDYQTPTSGPNSGGSFTQWIGVVNANVDVKF